MGQVVLSLSFTMAYCAISTCLVLLKMISLGKLVFHLSVGISTKHIILLTIIYCTLHCLSTLHESYSSVLMNGHPNPHVLFVLFDAPSGLSPLDSCLVRLICPAEGGKISLSLIPSSAGE